MPPFERKYAGMTIKAILFDKDGTLVDFHKTWMPPCWMAARFFADGDEDLARRLMAVGGYDFEADRMGSGSALAAANNEEIVDLWLETVPAKAGQRAELIVEVERIFVEEGLKHVEAVTDLGRLADELHGLGVRLGVATMDSERGAHVSLENLGVKHKFDYVVGYDSGHGSKPGPGMVHGFARQLGLETAAIMVVGDNLHDIDMGRSAGAGMVVGVLTGTSLREDLAPHADHVLDSIADLPQLLG